MSKIAALLPAAAPAAAGAGAAATAGGLGSLFSSIGPMQALGMGLNVLGSMMPDPRERAMERAKSIGLQMQRDEDERQNTMRQQALDQVYQTTDKVGGDQRAEAIGTEQDRRVALLQTDADANRTAGVDALPGLKYAGTEIRTDAENQLTGAATEAMGRLASLAKLSAYGTAGGAASRDIAKSAADVDLLGNLRRGGLRATNEARQLLYQNAADTPQGGIGSILSGLGSTMAYFGGGDFGGGGVPMAPAGGGVYSYYAPRPGVGPSGILGSNNRIY